MMSGILSQTNLLIFPLFAFVLFCSIFVGVLFWVFRPGSRAVYDARSRMVLEGNDTDTLNASEGQNVQP
jgi:cbb3-type cytochrome oxidase subunit 3